MKYYALLTTGLVSLATASAAQQVELDLWTIDDPGEYHYVMADEFMAAHPEIKINVRTVQFEDMVNDLARGVASGDAPDITYKSHTIMGKTFDPAEPEAYVSSFPIGKG